ncbi:hypothetical protein [Priestia megaterium]|uniref:hypothetical protein n=1 Tax=Priestia megaterium TaxID=1404 RepID=UPI002E23E4D6|nr:hypothetical protein [Priestia megaterium]
MVEKLLNLLDGLEAKDHKILDAIHALNVESDGFLTEESEQAETINILSIFKIQVFSWTTRIKRQAEAN